MSKRQQALGPRLILEDPDVDSVSSFIGIDCAKTLRSTPAVFRST